MQFGLLGSLSVCHGDVEVAVPAARQRVLLAALVLRAGEVVPADELAEAVWDGKPPAGAAVTLRSYVRRLRQVLGPVLGSRIATRSPGYLIIADEAEVDLRRFEALCRSGGADVSARIWPRASDRLAQALGLWRGAPLADVPSHVLHGAEVPRLEQLRLQATEWRIEADLHLGRHGVLVPELQAMAAAHPLRERFHVQLMLALHRCDRRAEALAAYRQARGTLASELGIEPGPELRQLHQRILTSDRDPDLAAPSGPGPPPVPRQLPAPARHFVGRTDQLQALNGLLEEAGGMGHTVVISAIGGTAGVGKTALALHWAHQVAGHFPGGQLFINLRGFGSSGPPVTPAQAIRGFLESLAVPPERIPASQEAQEGLYRSLLADRCMLVLLDNARDVEQVRPLLPAGPDCLVVVTSRSDLTGLVAADSAQPLFVDVLTEDEALELLSRRLGASRIAAEPDAAGQLTGLCARLPLALSIAAARAATRPGPRIAELVAELRNTEGRLDALNTGDAATSPRAVFSWSYQLLRPQAARLFRLLGLHPGPDISTAAAGSLAGIPVGQARRLLGELKDACLVAEPEPGRFGFHDLLRAYAAGCAQAQEQAGDRAAAIRRVLTWYLHTAAAAARVVDPRRRHVSLDAPAPQCEPLSFDGYDRALRWLETERACLVAAVACAGRHGAHEIAWKLPVTLWDLFSLRGYWSDWIESVETGLASARHLHDRAAEGWLLNHLAMACQQSGSTSRAIGCFRQALVIRRAIGDRRGEAMALANLGRTYSEAGQLPESMACLQEALSVFRETGQRPEQGRCLFIISAACRRLGRPQDAMTSARQAVDIIREAGDGREESGALTQLALASLCLAQPQEAITHSARAAGLSRRHGDRRAEAEALTVLGQALHDCGQPAQARQHRHAAYLIFSDLGDPRAAEILGLLGPRYSTTRT